MSELTTEAVFPGQPPPPPAGLPIDEAALLERVEGDRELLREIIELFLADSPQMRDAVRAAVDAGDPDALRKAAHGLKGAASNFGASEVVAAALALEVMGRGGDLARAAAGRDTLEAALTRLEAALAGLAARC